MVQNSKAKPQNDMNKYQQRLQIWGRVRENKAIYSTSINIFHFNQLNFFSNLPHIIALKNKKRGLLHHLIDSKFSYRRNKGVSPN